MTEDGPDPDIDPRLDEALSELLAQVEKEPVSPRLHELALKLEEVLNRRRTEDEAAR